MLRAVLVLLRLCAAAAFQKRMAMELPTNASVAATTATTTATTTTTQAWHMALELPTNASVAASTATTTATTTTTQAWHMALALPTNASVAASAATTSTQAPPAAPGLDASAAAATTASHATRSATAPSTTTVALNKTTTTIPEAVVANLPGALFGFDDEVTTTMPAGPTSTIPTTTEPSMADFIGATRTESLAPKKLVPKPANATDDGANATRPPSSPPLVTPTEVAALREQIRRQLEDEYADRFRQELTDALVKRDEVLATSTTSTTSTTTTTTTEARTLRSTTTTTTTTTTMAGEDWKLSPEYRWQQHGSRRGVRGAAAGRPKSEATRFWRQQLKKQRLRHHHDAATHDA